MKLFYDNTDEIKLKRFMCGYLNMSGSSLVTYKTRSGKDAPQSVTDVTVATRSLASLPEAVLINTHLFLAKDTQSTSCV